MFSRIIITTFFLYLAFAKIAAQEKINMTGAELLQKTIAFHDPKGNWSKLHSKFFFHASEPQDTAIYEELFLDNRSSFFGHISRPEGKLVEKGIQDTLYFSRINGDSAMTTEARKKARLSKRAITMARNSYVFLYGLPMKMTDKGVKVSQEVKMDTFNKKNYYVLTAGFEEGVGKDTWFLYINPTTFEMEGYRFHHNRKPNDGEFIICQGMIEVQGVKIPQNRTWYSNETGEYVAIDRIKKNAPFAWKKKNGTKLW